MYRNVIWDFDGTLFDTYPAMAGALRETLACHGYETSYEEVYALMKQSVPVAFDYYSKRMDWSVEIENEYAARRKAMEAEACLPYKGAAELLRDIAEAGGRNYIFTHRGSTLWPMLDRRGLRGLFVECVTSENGFARKPAPDGINYLMRKYDMDPAQTVMVGDRELDIQSGINAGIDTCAYCDGSGADINGAGAVARNMDEIRRIVFEK